MTENHIIFHIFDSPGPPLGSVLYELAGFGPPYYALGIFILTVTFIFMILLPKDKISTKVRLFHEWHRK